MTDGSPISGIGEVSSWLEKKGFSQYVEAFAKSGITIERLASLTEQDLKDLGVAKIVHRANLLTEIGLLTRDSGDPSHSPHVGSVQPGGEGAVERATPKVPAFPGVPQFPGLGVPSGGPIQIAPTVKSAPNKSAPNGPPDAMRALTTRPVVIAAPMRAAATPEEPVQKKRGWRRLGGKFLVISILVHLLFGIGAAYYVVQTISAKRKLTFKGGPPTTNPGQRAVEHRVQMAKKKSTMSAPAIAKRITSTAPSKVSLPAMPSMPSTNPPSPVVVAGMGGAGTSIAPQMGTMTAGSGGGGGSAIPLFGFNSQPPIGTLKGSLIDLKQLRNRKETKINVQDFDKAVIEFAKSGFKEETIAKYYKSARVLYATQFFIPETDSANGPEAFHLKGIVKPNMWIAHYVGKVSPSKSGTYCFVGEGDDFMIVKFEGALVLDSCWVSTNLLKSSSVYNYGSSAFPLPFKKGDPIHVEAGKTYDMEVMIGDQGGVTNAGLLIQEDGVEYKKDSRGNPILPVFRLAPSKLPPPPNGMTALPVMEDGPIWSAVMEKHVSDLDALKANH